MRQVLQGASEVYYNVEIDIVQRRMIIKKCVIRNLSEKFKEAQSNVLYAAIKYFSLKGKVQISKSKRPVTRKLRQQLIKIWLLFSCLFQKLLQIEYQAYE